jgi:hypothetical protein
MHLGWVAAGAVLIFYWAFGVAGFLMLAVMIAAGLITLFSLGTWYLPIGATALAAVTTYYGFSRIWLVLSALYLGIAFVVSQSQREDGGMFVGLFGPSESDKNREHQLRMLRQQQQHDLAMQQRQVDSTMDLTRAQLSSQERIAEIQAQTQQQTAAMQAYAVVESSRYQALASSRQFLRELEEKDRQRGHEYQLTDMSESTRRDIAFDTNKANITISKNKLEADALAINERIEGRIRVLREEMTLAREDAKARFQQSINELREEQHVLKFIFEEEDENRQAALLRRWTSKNQYR